MSLERRIAFVFGRPCLDAAKLQFMPFALSTLKTLAQDTNLFIDVYLTQSDTKAYQTLLPANVRLFFLDNKFVWSKGNGFKLYYLLNNYFRFFFKNKKYSLVFGVGQVGVVIAGKLAQRNNARFICLNDEFPDISYLKIWREAEKKFLAKADAIFLPDESRIDVLKKQVNFISKKHFGVLPNTPLQKDVLNLPNINWKQKLGLVDHSKLIIYAGGIDRENNIDFLLTVFPFTPPEFILVMVGNSGKYKNNRYLTHNRILWIEEPLNDGELHSLLTQALCSIAYYADFLDLEYVGKSSGKIMRSLLVGTPVISTNFESLKFIEEDGMGILISKPHELIDAINKIDKHLVYYKDSIKMNMHKYLFENYWKNQMQPLLE